MNGNVMKACMDYLMKNAIHPDYWKITEKSLVYYNDGKRTVVPLKDVEVA